MKPFNLDEYLANPNMKVVTRDGMPVRIICTDFNNKYFPVVAEVEGMYAPISVTRKGRHLCDASDTELDLFFATEKHEAWLNIYSSDFNLHIDNHLYASKARAEKEGKEREGYVSTGKFEWEE